MDTIGFRISRTGRYPAVDIIINGRDLVAMLREHEMRFAELERHPEIAGSYAGLPERDLSSPYQPFLGSPEPIHDYDGRTEILICDGCGEPGCWPFLARIEITPSEVRWSDFEQPHRRDRWTYDNFGPFTFDRRQYEEALSNPVEYRRG